MGTVRDKIGSLRHRLVLQEFDKAADGLGGFLKTWADRAFLWAEVTPRRMMPRSEADHLSADVSHHVRLRHRSDVTNGMRFKFQDRLLRIVACMDSEKERRFLTCLCVEEKE